MQPIKGKKLEEGWRLSLQRILKSPVTLVITDNINVFLSASWKKGHCFVRLHWMFLKAIKTMPHHIAAFIARRDKLSSKAIDRYIENHWHWVRHPLPTLQTKGKHFDLQKILTRLNQRYFKAKITSKITWGKETRRRAYEQLQLGSYSTSRNLITIHPYLDQKSVPSFVIEAVVFHELCHAKIPPVTRGERKQIHPPAFKELEATYPYLEWAKRWEAKNFSLLLRKGLKSAKRHK